MSGITNKVIIITGAGGGIGEATAILLAERGAKVVLADRRLDRLKSVAACIGAEGGDVAYCETDVTQRNDLTKLTQFALERFEKLDVFISNAGLGLVSPLDDLRVEEWIEMVDVNVKGLLHGIAAALPVFRTQGSGQFVVTASTAGFKTVPTMAVYSGTKYAVRAICEGLRQEAGDRLRVSIVSPGFVRTNFVDRVSNPQLRAELLAARDSFAIEPAAIGRAIAFAIEQPADVDINEIVVRPTAQS